MGDILYLFFLFFIRIIFDKLLIDGELGLLSLKSWKIRLKGVPED